eukprot:356303_1
MSIDSEDEMIEKTVSLDLDFDDLCGIAQHSTYEISNHKTTLIRILTFIIVNVTCIILCVCALYGHPLKMKDTELHHHAVMIHVAVISYLFVFLISCICFPILIIIWMKKLKVSEAIVWTLGIFLILDCVMVILTWLISFIGLHQSFEFIHGSTTETTYSNLPVV